MDRITELEQILNEVCEKYEDDCNSCPRKKECEEFCKLETE